MNVLALPIFISLVLVAAALLALSWSVRQGDHEHAERLSLLQLEDDRPRTHEGV